MYMYNAKKRDSNVLAHQVVARVAYVLAGFLDVSITISMRCDLIIKIWYTEP
jgi:hypothetical protein